MSGSSSSSSRSNDNKIKSITIVRMNLIQLQCLLFLSLSLSSHFLSSARSFARSSAFSIDRFYLFILYECCVYAFNIFSTGTMKILASKFRQKIFNSMAHTVFSDASVAAFYKFLLLTFPFVPFFYLCQTVCFSLLIFSSSFSHSHFDVCRKFFD